MLTSITHKFVKRLSCPRSGCLPRATAKFCCDERAERGELAQLQRNFVTHSLSLEAILCGTWSFFSLLCLLLSLLGLNLLGLSGFFPFDCVFLVVFFGRHLDGLQEALLGDAVVVDAIEGGLQSGQVLVGDVEPAVVAHPVGE